MRYIGTVQAAVTAAEFDREPSAADLAAIDMEMPAILADIELLDAQIAVLDRAPSPFDERRIRRARRRVLVARRELENQGLAGSTEVA